MDTSARLTPAMVGSGAPLGQLLEVLVGELGPRVVAQVGAAGEESRGWSPPCLPLVAVCVRAPRSSLWGRRGPTCMGFMTAGLLDLGVTAEGASELWCLERDAIAPSPCQPAVHTTTLLLPWPPH